MEYRLKKVVMTGGSGPVGLALIQKLLKENVEILLLQRELSDRRIYLPENERLHVEFCSLEEMDSYIPKETDYDVFFHLGWANVGPDTRNDLEKQNVNVKYSVAAVELAKRASCHTFIGVGSQAEYGRHDEALRGDTLCVPEIAYGVMKLCACHSTRLLCRKYGMRHIWPRILSGYGFYDNMSSVLVSAILNCMDGKKMKFSKGEQVWDFIYMDDIANALYLIAKKGRDGAIYPIGSGKARQLKEYIQILCEKLGKPEDMELGEIPYSDFQIMHLEADISELQADTGWMPEVEFEDGIERVIEFYKTWKVCWEKRYFEWSRKRQELERMREQASLGE